MKTRKLISCAMGAAVLASAGLVGCEDDEIYKVGAPADLQDRIDAIAAQNASKPTTSDELANQMEDVYTIGKEDFTSGWWSDWSKYYVIPEDTAWTAAINLHINPEDNTYYKNFALVLTNDVERGGDGYREYGAIRYDLTNDTAAYNSQWGSDIFFQFASSNQIMSPVDNKDAGLQAMNGKMTITVARSANSFSIKMTNGTVEKTYKQPYQLHGSEGNNIRCFLVPEGSYISFLSTNIEPVGGCTSANDKLPISLELLNCPTIVELVEGLDIDTIAKNVVGVVTFEEGVTKEVTAADLDFTAIPDLNEAGKKTLVATYAKTFKGEGVQHAVVGFSEFSVVSAVTEIIVEAPTAYFIGSADKLSVIPGLVKVTGVFSDGSKSVLPASMYEVLCSDVVDAKTGKVEKAFSVTHTTASGNVITVDVPLNIAASAHPAQEGMVGLEDLSTGWWTAFTQDWTVAPGTSQTVAFTVASLAGENWHSPCVILRAADMSEYCVVRSDNYGWGAGYEGNSDLVLNSNWNWDTFKTDIQGAKFYVTVSNNGNGTASIYYNVVATNGSTFFQRYDNIKVNADDLQFALTCESSNMTF